MLWTKKLKFIQKFLRLENSPPPLITFLMVRPLRLSWSRRRRETGMFGADIRPGLAWWRKREYLTFISIRFVAFSNHNFADYLLEIVPVFFESHFKLDF